MALVTGGSSGIGRAVAGELAGAAPRSSAPRAAAVFAQRNKDEALIGVLTTLLTARVGRPVSEG